MRRMPGRAHASSSFFPIPDATMSARWLASVVGALLIAGCGKQASTPGDGGACTDAGPCALSCGPGVDAPPYEGATHIEEPTPITYVANPPASGNHWGQW